jgi:SAM-dependent methyltransferase
MSSQKREAEKNYDTEFFKAVAASSTASAQSIVPLVIRLLEPKSVVDVGCGPGAWLSIFVENGVHDYLGIDGDYVDRGQLLIDVSHFRAMDLVHPVGIGRTFDLAVCLEVGEHLPTHVGPRLVQLLTTTAPAVLFSAAIPGQGGTHHVNEQWPGYWQQLFSTHGFIRLDPFRYQVLCDERVAWWYKQNLFLYVNQSVLEGRDNLRNEKHKDTTQVLELIHVDILNRYTTLSGLLSQIPGAAWRSLKNRLTASK